MKVFSIGPQSHKRMMSMAYVGVLVTAVGAFAYDSIALPKQSVQARVSHEAEFTVFGGLKNEGRNVVTFEILSGPNAHQEAGARFVFKNSASELTPGTMVVGQLTKSRLVGRLKLSDVEVVQPSAPKSKI